MKKLLLNLIVLGILLGCSNVNATTNKSKFDKKEVARIQEIDRLRGKALTEKLIKKNIDKEKDKNKDRVKEKVKSETVNKSDNETSSNGASENSNSAPNTSNDVVNNGGNNNTQTPLTTPPSNNNGGSNNTQTTPTRPPKTPQEVKPLTALGNSGKLFETRNQALTWGLEIIEDFDLSIEWSDALGFNIVGFSTVGVKMNNSQEWYSVEFY